MLVFSAWSVKHALSFILCTRYFIIRYLYQHPSGSCITTLVDPLVAMALGFLVLGGVGFNRYLLVRTFDPPTPPQTISLVWVHLSEANLIL